MAVSLTMPVPDESCRARAGGTGLRMSMPSSVAALRPAAYLAVTEKAAADSRLDTCHDTRHSDLTYSPDREHLMSCSAHGSGLFVTCRTERHGYTIAVLRGELDIASAPALREELLGMLRPGASRLIIDLSGVGYADASGVAVLVNSGRRARLLGGWLRLASPASEVAKVLSVTGISRHLAIFPTVEAAIADRGPDTGQRPDTGTVAARTGIACVARTLPVHAAAGRDADTGELRTAVTALLAHADAWRDADPRRRFTFAFHALARAYAGSSDSALTQAAHSFMSVLAREPLTHSPEVATSASRLRRLLDPGNQRVMS